MRRARTAAIAALLAPLILAGCAAEHSPSATPTPTWTNRVVLPQDREAFDTMARVAPDAARLAAGAKVEGTNCWTPSQHLYTDPKVAPLSFFRVICRVHYALAQAQRYTDVVCAGDLDKHPMLDQCYIWKPHLGQPTFEDGDALASPPPTPLP